MYVNWIKCNDRMPGTEDVNNIVSYVWTFNKYHKVGISHWIDVRSDVKMNGVTHWAAIYIEKPSNYPNYPNQEIENNVSYSVVSEDKEYGEYIEEDYGDNYDDALSGYNSLINDSLASQEYKFVHLIQTKILEQSDFN